MSQPSKPAPQGQRDSRNSKGGKRTWFPPVAQSFEITPEATAYAGRR
jgi:hypothetical protein